MCVQYKLNFDVYIRTAIRTDDTKSRACAVTSNGRRENSQNACKVYARLREYERCKSKFKRCTIITRQNRNKTTADRPRWWCKGGLGRNDDARIGQRRISHINNMVDQLRILYTCAHVKTPLDVLSDVLAREKGLKYYYSIIVLFSAVYASKEVVGVLSLSLSVFTLFTVTPFCQSVRISAVPPRQCVIVRYKTILIYRHHV